jgi:hypothetical protein
VYLCEDLHTSYWGDFGGGYLKPGTFIENTKGLIDVIHAWHSRSPELKVMPGGSSLLLLRLGYGAD